ncbi:hypothetical protein LOTGIDRAFT_168786 [Lottia gigantea]|uniref:C-type lectin domain-containing protein n=1 Tax=Lottia gigantea TaxID=225164 RepID=V3ZTW3_LOTGI|nr:hypothetical protein LOTGIDRAFT_168786 [Lottia gigantea]ESO84341.1 hypothetical protein LOTGIDRAFT_168786 [Lottia gigantea]
MTLECYLYDIRVWYGMGNKLENNTQLPVVHYWKVEDECSGDKLYERSFNLCYEFYPSERKPWNESREFCESKGGVLFMMDTSEKEHFWEQQALLLFADVCVGTTDVNHPNTWNWFNGVKVTNIITRHSFDPDEHCGIVVHRNLYSTSCTSSCIPLCEFPTSPNARV